MTAHQSVSANVVVLILCSLLLFLSIILQCLLPPLPAIKVGDPLQDHPAPRAEMIECSREPPRVCTPKSRLNPLFSKCLFAPDPYLVTLVHVRSNSNGPVVDVARIDQQESLCC
ncbi:hypothetical protein B0O80DRAFT_449748 [Mortierella sp. GBAus27b]|nr:hypothetical protein B0O80DRAFT_449748 [Mortierella sp. GBAus27b]